MPHPLRSRVLFDLGLEVLVPALSLSQCRRELCAMALESAVEAGRGDKRGIPLDLSAGQSSMVKSLRARSDASRSSVVEGQGSLDFVPDGRPCKLCGASADSKDPLDGGYLAWYYAPVGNTCAGHYCWYCGRVWFTYFKVDQATSTLTKMVSMCGSDQDLRDHFQELRAKLVDLVLEKQRSGT